MEFAKAKSKLTVKDATGHSVFELLSRITREVLENDISDPLEKFENISMRVKRDIAEMDGPQIQEADLTEIHRSDEQAMSVVTQLYQLYGGKQEIQEPTIEPQINEDEQKAIVEARQSDDIAADSKNDEDAPDGDAEAEDDTDQAKEETADEEAEEEEAEEEELDPEEILARERAHQLRMKETVQSVSNVLEFNHRLQWAGFRFDEEQLFQLHCSLTALARFYCDEFNAVQFWGKIQGTNADYWIAELTRRKLVSDLTEEEKTTLLANNPQRELPGEGTNEKVYCVINDPASINEWKRLPDIDDPQQIVKSQMVYKLLTGCLTAKVSGISAGDFEWTESVFLRALIARISSACQISPFGAYSLASKKKSNDEDEEDAEEDEEYVDEEGDGSGGATLNGGFNSATLLKINPDFFVLFGSKNKLSNSNDNNDEEEADEEENGDEQEDDPDSQASYLAKKNPSELYGSLQGWVHSACQINESGRVSDYIEPKPAKNAGDGDDDAAEDDEENGDADNDEDEDENADNQVKKPELTVPLLQPLSKDVRFLIGRSDNAAIKRTSMKKKAKNKCGMVMTTPMQEWNIRKICEGTSMETVVVRSLRWEGAVTVMDLTSRQWSNFYCGSGLEFTGQFYTPSLPPMVQPNYDEWRTFEEEITAPEPDENAEPAGGGDGDDEADGADDGGANEENADEDGDEQPAEPTIVTRIESVFKVQSEVPPPPPEPEAAEDAADEDGDAEAEE